MNRKLLTFSIAILLIALLAFNTQTAFSSLTASLPQPPALPNSSSNRNGSIIDNSTLPDVMHSQPQTFEEQDLFWDFLNKVAGLDTSNYDVTRFRITQDEMLGSQKIQTSISATLSNSQANLSIAIVLIEGKVRFYSLNLISGTLEGKTLDISDCLDSGRNAITQYQTSFNADYCAEFSQSIPSTLQKDKFSMDNENSLLTVERSKELNNQGRYAELYWCQKIDNLTVPALSIQAAFSKTGILTSFTDNIGLYKVATTNVAVLEENALDIAMPFINSYATENGRTIKSIDSQLRYVTDLNGTRGDSFLLYPQWEISGYFEHVENKLDYGYSVLIWADSGKVHYSDTQAVLPHTTQSTQTNPGLGIIAIMGVGSALVIVMVIRKQNTKKRLFKISGTILTAALCCSLIVVQPVLAIPSTIYGSRADLSETEVELDEDIADQISEWSTDAGYTAYNWHGSDTTAENLYVGAYDHEEQGSLVFYFGHGGHDPLGVWWWGLPPYFEKDRLVMLDDDGGYVYDGDIYENSYAQSQGHSKVAVLWSCYLGDIIGGFVDYPDESTTPQGMPFAWLHTDSLSSNGYSNPDYSGQAFIGWTGEGPQLHPTIDGQSNAAYWFLYHFYQHALISGFSLNAALDYAAQQLWQVNLDDCVFTSGQWTAEYVTHYGSLVVYGQGTLYIGEKAYVSDIDYWDSGYSIASGVFDPYNMVGAQNDGQFARIYAGNYDDYAYIISYLNRQASGEIHLWAHTVAGYSSHLIVYVSNDYSNWYTTYNGYITNSNPYDINCGSYNNFRYVAVCVYDDQGWSANLRVDAVHVSG